MIPEGVWNAVVIRPTMRPKVRREGVLKDYIRPKRALRASYATVRFETALPAPLHDDPVDTVLAQERCRVCVLR